jgi:hypothetical protein
VSGEHLQFSEQFATATGLDVGGNHFMSVQPVSSPGQQPPGWNVSPKRKHATSPNGTRFVREDVANAQRDAEREARAAAEAQLAVFQKKELFALPQAMDFFQQIFKATTLEDLAVIEQKMLLAGVATSPAQQTPPPLPEPPQ